MNRATRLTVSTLGTIMGLAGIEHGVGEVLQGNRAPDGLFILSWPNAPFFSGVGGEPAMTIIPNLLVTGILAILVSLAYIAQVVFFPHRQRAALWLLLLSVAMLLVGGGLFPPVLAAIVGLFAAKVNAPLTWWRARRALARAWPWAYGLSLAAWLTLMPGLNILLYFFAVDNAALTIAVILAAILSLALVLLAALARDASGRS